MARGTAAWPGNVPAPTSRSFAARRDSRSVVGGRDRVRRLRRARPRAADAEPTRISRSASRPRSLPRWRSAAPPAAATSSASAVSSAELERFPRVNRPKPAMRAPTQTLHAVWSRCARGRRRNSRSRRGHRGRRGRRGRADRKPDVARVLVRGPAQGAADREPGDRVGDLVVERAERDARVAVARQRAVEVEADLQDDRGTRLRGGR